MPNFEPACRCPGCGTCSDAHRAGPLREHVRARIAEIERDSRFAATAFASAERPLSRIQVELKIEHRVLTDILKRLGGAV